VTDTAWPRNPIDVFVLAALEKEHLAPAPVAGRLTLLRRVYFDVLGLPPPPEEVDRCAHDDSPLAYERLIDRLLSSPSYGERWARHWLDVVRYADSGGFENDHLYPSSWRFRDYVIRSLNADKPFDRFIQEQVAGDELWPDDPEAVLGSTLYCIGPALGESAMVENQLEYEWLTDAADTTGAAFLGLTLGCARCHDHKYDPIRQTDYVAMQAIFAASDRPYPEKIRETRIKLLNSLLSETPVPKELHNDPRCTVKTELQIGFRLFHREQPLEVRRLRRGELNKPREVVAPAFPSALSSVEQNRDLVAVPPAQRRAALARWLTSPSNPLTARVLLNRVWGWHFGQALARTPSDFGSQGEPPTHPELLDWLARDFVDHGWQLKQLHRRILLSSTYRMASAVSGPALERDPQNRLLWHFPRHRLESEAIRDAMLACSGELRLKEYGPPVVPPLGREELTGLFDAKSKWPVTKDATEYARRSIYLLVRRTFTYPMFAAFDPPEVMTSCSRRFQTVVPTQALTLLNSPVARGRAAAFAHRLRRETRAEPEQLVAHAWRIVFGRRPNDAERRRAEEFLLTRAQAQRSANTKSGAGGESALTDFCLALLNANEFAYVD
jgi:hypothetical protein